MKINTPESPSTTTNTKLHSSIAFSAAPTRRPLSPTRRPAAAPTRRPAAAPTRRPATARTQRPAAASTRSPAASPNRPQSCVRDGDACGTNTADCRSNHSCLEFVNATLKARPRLPLDILRPPELNTIPAGRHGYSWWRTWQ